MTVFGRQAETLAERVAKGTRVYVEGRLESRQYESQNGNKGFSMDVVANEVIVLDTRQRDGDFGGGAGELETAPPAPAARSFASRSSSQDDAADLEDLPF